jgi:hypothetical protein
VQKGDKLVGVGGLLVLSRPDLVHVLLLSAGVI